MANGQRIGYIRVSTAEQNTDRQLEGVLLDHTFTEHASGKDRERPRLEEMIRYAREGDTVFVHSIDRMARNLEDLRRIVKTLLAKGVKVEFVKENLVLCGEDSPVSTLMLSMIGSFAEFERAMIRERQREGIALAQRRGVYRGRLPSRTAEQVAVMRERVALGVPKAKVAKEFGLGKTAFYRYLSGGPVRTDKEKPPSRA